VRDAGEPVIEIAAIEDNRMLIDGLRAWFGALADIHLAMVTPTVEELLGAGIAPFDAVLLNPALRACPDPVVNVRRLTGAGHRVLVIDGSSEPAMAPATLAAGAHGYLTRDHGLAAVAATLRSIAADGHAWSIGPVMAAGTDGAPLRPPRLSEREHGVLVAYASGLTLASAARELGISTATAKTYLMRVKAKYRQAGLPVRTKLDLAERVRADCAGGPGQRPFHRAEAGRPPGAARIEG
jgi:two-component system, NarL family, nitrate/nitrite response regulator NarL